MSSSPQERLQDDIKDALRARESEKLGTLRLLLTEVRNKAIELRREVEEAEFLALVQKAIKQRREAADQFEAGDRAELAEKELREAAILEAYLPDQLGDEEIRGHIADFVSEQGLEGPAAIGAVMKEMMQRFSGSADGASINRIAREVLSPPD